jgi:hypothetical protein
MYPAKDVDNEFIQSDTYILSILSNLSDKDSDRKNLFTLILRLCQCYPMYLTIGVDTEFNHSDT